MQDLVGTSERLKKKDADVLRTSLLESDCSQTLRVASVQHIIFEVICNQIWQPFFSEYLWKHNGTRAFLEDLHVRLADDGGQVQRNWKVSTLKMLGQLDATSDSLHLMDFLTEEVIGTVHPLLDDRQTQFLEPIPRRIASLPRQEEPDIGHAEQRTYPSQVVLRVHDADVGRRPGPGVESPAELREVLDEEDRRRNEQVAGAPQDDPKRLVGGGRSC